MRMATNLQSKMKMGESTKRNQSHHFGKKSKMMGILTWKRNWSFELYIFVWVQKRNPSLGWVSLFLNINPILNIVIMWRTIGFIILSHKELVILYLHGDCCLMRCILWVCAIFILMEAVCFLSHWENFSTLSKLYSINILASIKIHHVGTDKETFNQAQGGGIVTYCPYPW